jgi:hypothetical protein
MDAQDPVGDKRKVRGNHRSFGACSNPMYDSSGVVYFSGRGNRAGVCDRCAPPSGSSQKRSILLSPELKMHACIVAHKSRSLTNYDS